MVEIECIGGTSVPAETVIHSDCSFIVIENRDRRLNVRCPIGQSVQQVTLKEPGSDQIPDELSRV